MSPVPAQLADGTPLLLGRCCRDWPMVPAVNRGRCGLCGESPEILGLLADPDPDDADPGEEWMTE